jgi:hypothetical protein
MIVRRTKESGALWVVGSVTLCWVLAHGAGVSLDASVLRLLWQPIDSELLRENFFQSLLYSHTEPPLFDFFLGAAINWSPLSVGLTFTIGYFILDVVLGLSVLDAARTIKVPRTGAIVVAVLVACSPAAILYSHFLFPTFPTTVMLTLSIAAFARWVRDGRVAAMLVLAGSTLAATMTTALIHPIWFPIIIGLALLARRPVSRRNWNIVLTGVAIPALLIFGLLLKNQVLFGTSGFSSWFGMNLSRTTVSTVSQDEIRDLIDRGVLDQVALIPPFLSLDSYPMFEAQCEPNYTDIAVLSQRRKSNSPTPNFNNECYLPIYAAYQKQALAFIAEDPVAFAGSKLTAAQIMLMPSSDYPLFLNKNRSKIATYDSLYSTVVLGTFLSPETIYRPEGLGPEFRKHIPLSLTIAFGFIVTCVAGIWAALRWRRDGVTTTRATLAAISLLTVFVFAVGTAFEIGENERFRYMVEPIMFVLLARVATELLNRYRSRQPKTHPLPIPETVPG